jgi:glycosyltransferase involved in cell wall biosynthesis
MLNFYKVTEKKIKVIYPTLFNYQLKKKEILIPKNFLLYVGHRNGYKNFKVLLKSFINIHKKYDLYLICVGGEILTNLEKKQLSDLKVTEKIRFISLTDEELNYCYSKALCFIYPSLYEGFGKTILEAAINNCITICSDIPAFKETAGDSVLYFNPNNPDQLQHIIINIIESKIENLRNKMYKNLKRFSYIKSKNKLKKIYLNI